MTAYVAGFLIDPFTRRVALVRKNRPEWQAGRLNGIGGHIEEGETADVAMRREFAEEAGLDLDGWEGYARVQGDWGSVTFFRLLVGGEIIDSVTTVEDETIELHDVDDLPISILPNLTWLVPLALYTHDRYGLVIAEEVR